MSFTLTVSSPVRDQTEYVGSFAEKRSVPATHSTEVFDAPLTAERLPFRAHQLLLLGNVQRLTHRPKEAESAFQAALGIWKQLLADLPLVPDLHHGLGGTLCKLAMLRDLRREFDAALALLE